MTQALEKGDAQVCTECGSKLARHSGFVVCQGCGLTHGKEYTNGTYELGARNLSGIPASRHLSIGKTPDITTCLGSDVGYYNSPELKGVTSNDRVKFLKMRKLQNRTRQGNISELRVLMRLRSVCDSLKLSKRILERTAFLLRLAKAKGCKENYPVLTTRCLLVAAREARSPVTDNEIIDAWRERYSQLSPFLLKRAAFWIREHLGVNPGPRRPLDYLPSVLSCLKNSQDVKSKLSKREISESRYFSSLESRVRAVLESLTSLEYGSRRRRPLVVSLCYTISRRDWYGVLSQRVAAQACSVAECTIRDHHRFWENIISQGHLMSLSKGGIE